MDDRTLEPLAVSQHWRLPFPSDRWESILTEYLETLCLHCDQNGGCLVGHIKALALFPGGGYLQVSVVSPRNPASVTRSPGGVPALTAELTLTLNLIVYGVSRDELFAITQETSARLAEKYHAAVTTSPETLRPEPGHHHHDDHENHVVHHED